MRKWIKYSAIGEERMNKNKKCANCGNEIEYTDLLSGGDRALNHATHHTLHWRVSGKGTIVSEYHGMDFMIVAIYNEVSGYVDFIRAYCDGKIINIAAATVIEAMIQVDKYKHDTMFTIPYEWTHGELK